MQKSKTHDRLSFGELTVPVVIDEPQGYEASHINPADCRAWTESFSIEAVLAARAGVVQSLLQHDHLLRSCSSLIEGDECLITQVSALDISRFRPSASQNG